MRHNIEPKLVREQHQTETAPVKSGHKVMQVVKIAIGCMAVAIVTMPSVARAEWTPLPLTELMNVVDLTGLQIAVASLAGGALVASFMVGGGFRIAKKGFSWMLSKI